MVSRYKAYQNTDLNWLGEVPAVWSLSRHKDHFSFITERCTNPTFKKVGLENIESKTGKFIESDSEFEGDGVEFKINDILFGKLRPYLAKVYLAEFEGNAVGDIFVYRAKNTLSPEFASYLMLSDRYIDVINSSTAGAKMPRVGSSFIANLAVAVPNKHEQKEIVSYLNKQKKELDNKIELLSIKAKHYEKLKQSLINEAVTRGLDKTLAMKDSGIEWIGEVPEHWEVKRVKELFSITRGRVIAQTELIDDGQFPVYSSQTVNNGCMGYINTYDYDGDFITWTTDGVNAGTVFLRSGKFNCTNICGILKLISKNNLNYLYYALEATTKHNKRLDTNGAKIMSNEMMFIKITLPPLEQQKEIAEYLIEKTAKIDQIMSTINYQIEKLKELRKTLINDVVTGKIKVIQDDIGEGLAA